MKLMYCDESCHLENDDSPLMVLGVITCIEEKKKKAFEDIKKIKEKHGLDINFEIKWTKVSMGKIEFYKEIVDYFFKNDFLEFRGVIASKKRLKFENEKDGYSTWYYKMYYLLLSNIIYRDENYKIYLDVKDTLGGPRVRKLKDVLCNNIYDFKSEVIKDIQQVHSKNHQILQLTDLIIGALSYSARNIKTSEAKLELINKIIKDTKLKNPNFDINKSTKRNQLKFNIFFWEGVSDEVF